MTIATGRYRVEFRLAETGIYASLRSSTLVDAPSRADAVASVPGGIDASVLVWGPNDPEVIAGTQTAGVRTTES